MKLIVKDIPSKTRLDVYLLEHLQDITRSAIKKLIEAGSITLNKKIVKAGTELRVGDEIEVVLPEPINTDVVPQDIPLDIVYQDDDLLVINKAQGMVVHPASGNYQGTLVNALLYCVDNLSSINGEIRPGIVHRLDKDTSGLMLVAKNDFAHNNLSQQISHKTCTREYLALLEGVVKKDEGEIITHIGRDSRDRKKMAVVPDMLGKEAITHYWVVHRYAHYTLVRFRLGTGRTHQIRVHAKHMGHPVVGDPIYNSSKNKFDLKGQLLHSCYIQFTQPHTNKSLSFESPLPKYFEQVLQKLD